MITNGPRTRTNPELTEYQKKIEIMDNVILCVAEAERMIDAIGLDMIREHPELEITPKRRKSRKIPWADPRNMFKR